MHLNCRKKAVLTLMVGMAFFLISCQSRLPTHPEIVPLETRFPVEAALSDHQAAVRDIAAGQYEKALRKLQEIEETYPDYSDLKTVQYQIVEVLYHLGKTELARDAAFKWLRKYPLYSQRSLIYMLLGEDFGRSGDYSEGFNWLLMAKRDKGNDADWQEMLDKKLVALIDACDFEEIEKLADYAAKTDYAPKAYYRLATAYLENNELEKAARAADLLIESTTEESWILLAHHLMERIRAESFVRKGVVGCLLPLSGPFAIYGDEVLKGIKLGMGMFGESGPGQVLELVIKDTKGEAVYSLAGLESLVKEGNVMAVIGPLSSKTVGVTAKRAQEMGVPIITLTQKEGITEEGQMVFRNFLTPSQEVQRLIDVAINEIGLERFGLLYPDNSYGRILMNLFWDKLEEMGGIVNAVESYDPDDTDFADPIKKMTGLYFSRPDSVIQKLKELKAIEELGMLLKIAMAPDEEDELALKNFSYEIDAGMSPDNFSDKTEAGLSTETYSEETETESFFEDTSDEGEFKLEILDLPDETEEESDLEDMKLEPIVDFDAVFIPDNYQRIAMIAPQLVYHDVVDVTLLGTSLWQSPQLIELAGDYVQDAVFSSGFFEYSGEPHVAEFVEAYRKSFDVDPSILAATGYDTIRLLRSIMAEEGILTRTDLRKALLKSPDFEGVTGTTSFSPQGDVMKKPFLLTISGRRMTLFP